MDALTSPHTFTIPAEWDAWLAANHARSPGIWLLIAKKNAKRPLITIGEALDVALCYGWIDSQRKGFDTDPICNATRPGGEKPLVAAEC